MTTVIEHDTLPRRARAERVRVTVEDDAGMWRLVATEAREGLRLRHAFRDYLEAYGDPVSDFDAAETVFGELVANCATHAPGSIRIEFRWDDATLVVIDDSDRLRHWPFSPGDTAAESTHHAFAIVNGLTGRVHVTRHGEHGTRASVVLPVVPAIRATAGARD
jgi:anti-sigma regulatory factor (Ser/Thr protein kinase)